MKKHLTEEQARKLLEALPGHPLEAIIMLALVTGLRRDELLGLKWQGLDLEKREVRVRNTKTQSSDRMIHLPTGVTEVLEQHRIRQMEEQAELPPLRFHELRLARWRALSARLRTAKEGLEGAQDGSLDLDNDTYPF